MANTKVSNLEEFDKLYGEQKGFSLKPGFLPYKPILIDSGSLGINLGHGIGGIKSGSVIRLMGHTGSGKTSLAYRMVADGLKKGMSALIIDLETTLSEDILFDTLEDYGLDPDDPKLPLRYVPSSDLSKTKIAFTTEEMFPLIETWIKAKDISPNGAIVVIDSIDMSAPSNIIESGVDEPGVALVARMLKNWLRKFMGTIRGTNSIVIFINQVSSKIATTGYDMETFSGGNGLVHEASVTIRFKKIGQLQDADKNLIGERVKWTLMKSKQGVSWRTGEFDIRGDVGPDRVGEAIDIADKLGIIQLKQWIEWLPLNSNTPIKINGRLKFRDYLIENPGDRTLLESKIYMAAHNKAVADLVPLEEQEIE